jgi:hypothetical protein
MTVNLQGPNPSDPVGPYHLGQAFYLAGRRCQLDIVVGPGVEQCLTSPAVVNLCLAAELFMKSLIIGTGQTAPKTHELDKLFASLPDADRSAVEAVYTASIPSAPLADLLAQVSKYFVQVRYGHEFNVFSYSEYPIMLFADALYKHCAALFGGPSIVYPVQV